MFHETADKQNLYYEVHGNWKAEKTLIFLNGLSQSTLAWNTFVPVFSETYRILLCDLIFQGKSGKAGEYRDFDQHASDIHGLVEALQIRHVVLAGISYGSLVAQHYALLFSAQLENLILLSTFARKTPYFEAIETAWHSALDRGGYALLMDVMLPAVLGMDYFSHPNIPLEKLKTEKTGINTDTSALKKLMMATKLRGDYREKLKLIRIPTLVIHGGQDLLLPVFMGREVSAAIPGSRFEIIPESGHTLNLEAPEETCRLILDHLNRTS
jgi:3-oxoadipate enol-lactonase